MEGGRNSGTRDQWGRSTGRPEESQGLETGQRGMSGRSGRGRRPYSTDRYPEPNSLAREPHNEPCNRGFLWSFRLPSVTSQKTKLFLTFNRVYIFMSTESKPATTLLLTKLSLESSQNCIPFGHSKIDHVRSEVLTAVTM
jgi:hypothetical protein